LPNNTGKLDDDLAVHEADVKKRMAMSGAVAAMLKVAVLMPVLPRPKSDWRIYTHALDRDSMLTEKKEYRRFDLQLLAMIDHAIGLMKKDGIKVDKRVLINGFSAQGMFANRFTFLHPKRVKAAAIGSPGGWPIAPASRYKDKELRYPIGTADLKLVSGKKLDIGALRKVPMFVFVGAEDDDDSVPFDDSYDEPDRELINPLLGKTPIERWAIAKQLYADARLNAEFRLYPGVKHTVNDADARRYPGVSAETQIERRSFGHRGGGARNPLVPARHWCIIRSSIQREVINESRTHCRISFSACPARFRPGIHDPAVPQHQVCRFAVDVARRPRGRLFEQYNRHDAGLGNAYFVAQAGAVDQLRRQRQLCPLAQRRQRHGVWQGQGRRRKYAVLLDGQIWRPC
jgi:dienelactone hydrolase